MINTQRLPVGIGLRYPHYTQVLREHPPIDWLEVHSENFFHGGSALETLCAIKQHYPISLHGVGLSLGSAEGIDPAHLKRLKQLVTQIDPFLLSEHLSWSRVAGIYLPDLLPIPYTKETLAIFCENVARAQDFLGRELLIENPSSYIEYTTTQQCEVDFLISLCERTGASILLDVNNVFVSCQNHGWDALAYLNSIPAHLIKEIHIAGHSVQCITPDTVLHIDTHDQPVCPSVWKLYAHIVKKCGAVATLLERDANLPSLPQLIQEAEQARYYLHELHAYA